MDTQRLILFVILGLSGFMLWDSWVKHQHPELQQKEVVQAVSPSEKPQLSGSGAIQKPPKADVEAEPAELVAVETRDLSAKVSPIGARIVSLTIKNHGGADQPFVLFSPEPDAFQEAESGLLGDKLPSHRSRYALAKQTTAEGKTTLVFVWRGEGAVVTKTLEFGGAPYLVDVSYRLDNQGKDAMRPGVYFQLARNPKVGEHSGMFLSTFSGAAIYSREGKYSKFSSKEIAEGKVVEEPPVQDGWVALVQHYFLAGWLLPNDVTRQAFTRKISDQRIAVGMMAPDAFGEVAAGGHGEVRARLYAGPQAQQVLGKVADGLELTVDYGWLRVIAAPLYDILAFIHRMVGNWGVAIILLTVLVKGLFYPLSAYSYKSMAHMRNLAPKLQQLKERYGDDKQRMHEAMMEMYRTEKINPLGGCLPVVVQIPVFIALYWVLLYSVELKGAPFFGWIHDLSVADPYYVLPVIMGITMFVQTKLNPTPPDPIQAKVMMIMPLVFSVFFFFFPSGLVLYWVVNNMLSILQQWRINTVVARAGAK